jgi:hypothetical protein
MNLFLVRYPDKPIQVPNKGKISIGRSDDNNIIIAESRVSRRHAIIEFKKPQFVIGDVGSSNGTFLNGHKLVPNQQFILNDWDKIRIASAVYTARMVEKPAQIMDEFKELRSRVHADVTEIIDVKELMTGGGQQSAFSGDLAHLTPVELLQMIETGGKSGMLALATADGEGTYTISNGHIAAAQFKELRGEEAVYAILQYNQGTFNFSPQVITMEAPEITESITFLLMEGCRRLDEASMPNVGTETTA